MGTGLQHRQTGPTLLTTSRATTGVQREGPASGPNGDERSGGDGLEEVSRGQPAQESRSLPHLGPRKPLGAPDLLGQPLRVVDGDDEAAHSHRVPQRSFDEHGLAQLDPQVGATVAQEDGLPLLEHQAGPPAEAPALGRIDATAASGTSARVR